MKKRLSARARHHRFPAALLLMLLGLAFLPDRALASGSFPVTPTNWWQSWTLDPLLLVGLAVTGWFYGRGVWALWQRAGIGRGISQRRVAAFTAGLLTLIIALISPLDSLSLTLFSAHMVQHLLLMMVAAPLLVFGAPPVALAWMAPRPYRLQLVRWWHTQAWLPSAWQMLTRPVTVWMLHVATLWFWHMPLFYRAALNNEWIHWLQHATFFGTALLFWWVLAQCGRPGHLAIGAGVIYLFTMAFQGGLLGSLLTFAPTAWYPVSASATYAWGLTPLEDQQLAGALMWIPASFIYAGTALIMFGRWLNRQEQADRHRRAQRAAQRYPAYLPEGD